MHVDKEHIDKEILIIKKYIFYIWGLKSKIKFYLSIHYFLLVECGQFMLFVHCIEWHFIKWEWAKRTSENVEICETYEFFMDHTC